MATATTRAFRRELLPAAIPFYERELGRLGRPNHAGWCPCRCPFHNSKSGRSFAVHVDGGFICRGCGVRGGDVISFLRLRDGLSFKEACQQLGCWDGSWQPTKPSPGPLVRYLVLDFVLDGVEYRAEVNNEPKSDLQAMRKVYADASDRLAEMRNGAAEKFEGEEEVQWGIMASSWELVQMEVGDAR